MPKKHALSYHLMVPVKILCTNATKPDIEKDKQTKQIHMQIHINFHLFICSFALNSVPMSIMHVTCNTVFRDKVIEILNKDVYSYKIWGL